MMSSSIPNKTDVSNPTQRRSPSPHSAKPSTHGTTNGVSKRSPIEIKRKLEKIRRKSSRHLTRRPTKTHRGGATKGKSLRKVKKVIKKAGKNTKKARPVGARKAGSTGKRIRNASRNSVKKFNFF